MKRRSVATILLLFFMLFTYGTGYESSNTREYCQRLLDSAKQERTRENFAKYIEISTEAKKLAETNNWTDLKAKALNSLAVAYQLMADYENAIKYYLEAYQIIIKESSEEYKLEELKILNNISALYFLNKDFDKAKEYVNKAYQEAIQLQDSLKTGIYAANLASLANKTGELKEAEQYLNIAVTMLKNKEKDLDYLLKSVRMETLYLEGEYNKAEELALNILHLKNLENDFKVETLLYLSRIYQQEKEYPKAIRVAKEALAGCSKLPLTLEIYEHLSKLYLDINDPYSSVRYLDSLIIAKDSLAKIMEENNIMANQVKFELLGSEKLLAENKAKQKAERILFIFVLVFMLILTAILIWMFRIRSAKTKQQKIIMEKEQLITKLELEKEKSRKMILEQQLKEQETSALLEQEKSDNERKEKLLLERKLKEQEVFALLEQERLNNEIDAKNKQLTAEFMIQSSKKTLIDDITAQLCDISPHVKSPLVDSMIRQLKIQSKELIGYDGFLIYFEKINPVFLSSLREKHPNLTVNEIRFLSYIYLDLEMKEIASLMNISLEGCRKKKQRLAIKMELETTELYTYLINLSNDSTGERN